MDQVHTCRDSSPVSDLNGDALTTRDLYAVYDTAATTLTSDQTRVRPCMHVRTALD